jgi:hypothetical protein
MALAGMAAVTACSSATTYQNDASNFSLGVTALAAATDQAGKAYASVLFQNASAAWATQPVQLALSLDCSIPLASPTVSQTIISPASAASAQPIPPCQIIQSGTGPLPPDIPQIGINNAAVYLAALQKYAADLVSITNSTDSDTLTKNVASFNTALTQLGSTVASAYPQDKTPEQTAVSGAGALGSLFTSYFNALRFRALRDAVHNANPIVAHVADLIDPVLVGVKGKLVDHLMRQAAAMPIMVAGQAAKVTGKDRITAIATALTKANQINAVLAADPAGAAKGLAEAHAMLDAALQGVKSEADVVLAMSTFLKAAQNVQTAFTQATTNPGQ